MPRIYALPHLWGRAFFMLRTLQMINGMPFAIGMEFAGVKLIYD